ncbi:2-C-methyl-D-erythritol 4-phosphate cytidylyltransferase [Parablautia muri]|uniref:2-C-methyl-D-erythritol 4-phosphate cytidylyltransferase n=1 Tax=Parablautia muri TaxID=2320879 RepID=A0A9X5GU53_9FIRM|nr:2-C-methyl-D-erythritol 4-phosphate cytidylyltransferase [Parablautia muri]NBJ94495.1 2-C-methyl-D-erythritol 4-phosphate cytidylyltransferase [Parablautia muri]
MSREKKLRTAAVVLAAGSGKRMESSTKKQYMLIAGKPVIYYSLKTFQESFVDEIVLVVSPGDAMYCKKEIVEKYGFSKVQHIVEGGKERYHSVAIGLDSISSCDFVFIHDGARPVVTEDILERALCCVREYEACVVGMPVKDTIKIADREGNIASTPERKLVWTIQTPQAFALPLIKGAYQNLLQKEKELLKAGISVTDDAMVIETLTGHPVRLVEGSYENIKITTPEDIQIAEHLLLHK